MTENVPEKLLQIYNGIRNDWHCFILAVIIPVKYYIRHSAHEKLREKQFPHVTEPTEKHSTQVNGVCACVRQHILELK